MSINSSSGDNTADLNNDRKGKRKTEESLYNDLVGLLGSASKYTRVEDIDKQLESSKYVGDCSQFHLPLFGWEDTDNKVEESDSKIEVICTRSDIEPLHKVDDMPVLIEDSSEEEEENEDEEQEQVIEDQRDHSDCDSDCDCQNPNDPDSLHGPSCLCYRESGRVVRSFINSTGQMQSMCFSTTDEKKNQVLFVDEQTPEEKNESIENIEANYRLRFPPQTEIEDTIQIKDEELSEDEIRLKCVKDNYELCFKTPYIQKTPTETSMKILTLLFELFK